MLTQRSLWRTWIETHHWYVTRNHQIDTTSSLEDVDWNGGQTDETNPDPDDTTSSLEDVDWNVRAGGPQRSKRKTQRPLWRTWIETVYYFVSLQTGLDTTSSLEDVDWNALGSITRLWLCTTQRPLWRTWIETSVALLLYAHGQRHNVLFGGRGLKLSGRGIWSCRRTDTTSSSEDVDWNCSACDVKWHLFPRHNVLFGGRGLKLSLLQASAIGPTDTTSSSEDVDWNLFGASTWWLHKQTQRPLRRTWIETKQRSKS